MESEQDAAPGAARDDDFKMHWDILREFIVASTKLLNPCISVVLNRKRKQSKDDDQPNNDDNVDQTIVLMLQAMGSSCHSVAMLTAEPTMAIRDCFGIARSIFETAVNIAYIIAVGNEAATRAQRHSLQKTFRDMDRTGKVGGISYSVGVVGSPPDPKAIPGLEAALAEFTDRRGNESRHWTPDSLEKRIEIIRAKYGDKPFFAGPYVAIYRHSSDILHGTYYGSVFFWRRVLGEGAVTPNQMLLEHLLTIFNTVFFSIQSIVAIIAIQYDILALKKKNSDLFEEFRGFLKDLTKYMNRPDVGPGPRFAAGFRADE